MELYVASLLFYAYVYLVCYALRRWLASRPWQARLRLTLDELVATVQVCAPIFDVGFILDNYGLLGVFVEIVFLELLNIFTLQQAMAHPLALVNAVRQNALDLTSAAGLFLAQFVGAFLSYYVTLLFWALRLVPEHYERFEAGRLCNADLTVSVLAGFIVELLATLLGRVAEQQSERYLRGYESYACSCVSAFLTVLGIHLTGLYCNPIVASACTFNCIGVSTTGHLAVYWLGPLAGWLLADIANQKIDQLQVEHRVSAKKVD